MWWRVMRAASWHLTLAFLGSTPADRVDELIRAVPSWPAPVAPVTLRRFGRFVGPRIVWAGPGVGEDESLPWLDRLHDELWNRLEALGWQRPDEIGRASCGARVCTNVWISGGA